MDLYIPYGYTPHGEDRHYGVFSTRGLAEQVLKEEKANNYYEDYDIYVLQLDTPKTF